MTPCNYRSYSGGSYYSRSCGKPAVKAAVNYSWKKNQHVADSFEPRCGRHASIDARRRYSPRDIVDITPAMEKTWTEESNERARLAAIETAKKRDEADARAARITAAEAEAQTVEYEVVRDDDTDTWEALTAEREGRPIPKIPRWFVRPVGSTRTFDTIEVKVVDSYGQPRIATRGVNELTPNAVVRLVAALKAANDVIAYMEATK